MIYPQRLRAVDPSALAVASGVTKVARFSAPTPPVVRPLLLSNRLRGCCAQCDGGMAGLPPDYGTLRGLGILDQGDTFDLSALQVPSQGSGNVSILQTAALGVSFIPGIGQIAGPALSTFGSMLSSFQKWLGIGAGRTEANIIVPVQNNMMAQLGTITNQILTGANPGVATLEALYRQVWTLGVGFQEFVLMRNFTDRRASGQALNTVMPYIDGSCGYPVPVSQTASPGQQNCITWGNGTIGGAGTNGMLGAIARAIQAAGSSVPILPDLHQSANSGIQPTQIVTNPTGITNLFSSLPPTIMGVSTPLAFMIGIGAFFLYKKGAL